MRVQFGSVFTFVSYPGHAKRQELLEARRASDQDFDFFIIFDSKTDALHYMQVAVPDKMDNHLKRMLSDLDLTDYTITKLPDNLGAKLFHWE